MKLTHWLAAGVALIAAGIIVLSTVTTAGAQQGSGGQPGGAAAPRPANPQPRPVNDPPATGQAQQAPKTGQPGAAQPTTINPNGVTPATAAALHRYERPFAFQSPGMESRFTDSTRRLVAYESRMNTANQTLLKRLGDVRNLPPERQNAALTDIIQQLLMDQAQMQKYLVQSRTAWSGEIEGVPDTLDNGTQIVTPSDAAATSPTAGVPAEQPQPQPR